jgi:hypothetical protein
LLVEAADDLGYNIYEQGAGRLNIKKLITQSSVFGHGGVWIRPGVINFGSVAKGTEVYAEILIEEFRRGRTLSLELEIRDVFTGELRNSIVQLNTTTVEIGPGGQKAVKLTILPSAPTGLYSGKIKITDNYTQTYNVIFGAAVLNRLNIHKIPMEGPGQEWAVSGDYAYVFILDPDSEAEYRAGRKFSIFNSTGDTYLFLPDGTYEVTTVGEYSGKSVYLAFDNLILTTTTSITLDERNSYEVRFDPAKSGQTIAEVFHGILSDWICPPTLTFCYRHGLIEVLYYPAQTSVYYSYSTVMWSIDRYVYYPVSDVNPSDPHIISTNIWHDLLYVEKEIRSSKTRVADYTQLVTKHTEYRTSVAPRQSAERTIWAYRSPMETIYTISWLMNVPYSRTEIVTPDTFFYGFYRKVADLPGFSTPYWEYYGWFWTGGMAGSETKEVWGEQPLFPTVKFVNSMNVGSGRFDIILGAETFADSNYYYVQWFHSRCPLDNINFKVYRDGVEIPINYWSIWWCFWGDYYLGLWSQTPAKYTLKTTAYENQPLSTRTVIEYDFRLKSDGSISRAPVVTNIDVKDLSLNNTLERPRVDIKFQLWNETAIQKLTFEYSVDGGATWLSAPVNVAGPNTYTTSFTVYGQKYVSIRINATDTNNLKTSVTTVNGFLVLGPSPFYLFVTGLGRDVWYRDFDGISWRQWRPLGGITPNGPSATYFNGKLYVAVKDATNGIWLGDIDPITNVFSGWRPLPGLTPSKPTLVSSDHGLVMVVRDISNGIWVYKISTGEWISLPGLTVDSPAATAIRDILHIVVRGIDGSSLWHGTLNLTSNIFSGWIPLDGLSDATPDLTNNGTHVILVVKATGGDIWMNSYSGKWLGWRPVPGGLTDTGPAVTALYGKLLVIVKDINVGIWVNIYEEGTWRGWIPIDGLTSLQPELVSTT